MSAKQGVEAVLHAPGVGFAGGELELAQHHPGLRCTFIASTAAAFRLRPGGLVQERALASYEGARS
jgi:hypothetical protein